MELPSDIVSAIASMADEERDVKVVKACALVSRVWSLGARPYVFRRVAVRDEASLEEFLDLLCKTQDVQGYVQGLSFERKRTSAAEPSSTWVLSAPRRLSNKLPMVHEISFHKVFDTADSKPNNELFEGLATFTSVTNLSLSQCGRGADFVFRCAGIFPNLQHIRIHSPVRYLTFASCLDNPHIQAECTTYPMAPESLRLSTLHVSNASSCQMALLKWLAKAPSLTQVRSLRVDFDEPFEHLSRVMLKSGPSLEELDLNLVDPLEYLPFISRKLLRTCTRLRRLTLRVVCEPDDIATLLQRVPSQNIEYIGIGLTQRREEWQIPNLTKLGKMLANKKFASVRRVHFMYTGPIPQDVVLDVLEATFPPSLMRKLTCAHKLRDTCMLCS